MCIWVLKNFLYVFNNAIFLGAESLGFPGVVHGLFPKGGAELVEYFYHISNQNLVILLIALAQKHGSDNTLYVPKLIQPLFYKNIWSQKPKFSFS